MGLLSAALGSPEWLAAKASGVQAERFAENFELPEARRLHPIHVTEDR